MLMKWELVIDETNRLISHPLETKRSAELPRCTWQSLSCWTIGIGVVNGSSEVSSEFMCLLVIVVKNR